MISILWLVSCLLRRNLKFIGRQWKLKYICKKCYLSLFYRHVSLGLFGLSSLKLLLVIMWVSCVFTDSIVSCMARDIISFFVLIRYLIEGGMMRLYFTLCFPDPAFVRDPFSSFPVLLALKKVFWPWKYFDKVLKNPLLAC